MCFWFSSDHILLVRVGCEDNFIKPFVQASTIRMWTRLTDAYVRHDGVRIKLTRKRRIYKGRSGRRQDAGSKECE